MVERQWLCYQEHAEIWGTCTLPESCRVRTKAPGWRATETWGCNPIQSETALRACWAACAVEPAHGLHSASGSWLGRDPSFVEEARDLAATQLENIQQHLRQPLWCPSSLTFEKQESAHEVTCRRKKEKSNLYCKVVLQKAGAPFIMPEGISFHLIHTGCLSSHSLQFSQSDKTLRRKYFNQTEL